MIGIYANTGNTQISFRGLNPNIYSNIVPQTTLSSERTLPKALHKANIFLKLRNKLILMRLINAANRLSEGEGAVVAEQLKKSSALAAAMYRAKSPSGNRIFTVDKILEFFEQANKEIKKARPDKDLSHFANKYINVLNNPEAVKHIRDNYAGFGAGLFRSVRIKSKKL